MSKSSAKVVPESKEDTGSSNPAKTPTPPETTLLENTGEKNANKETAGRENKETMVGESKKVAEDGETEEESEGDEKDSEEDDGDNEEGDSGKEDSDEDGLKLLQLLRYCTTCSSNSAMCSSESTNSRSVLIDS